jgi:tetratricopeptide (TPR) repeat protein
MVGIRSIPNVRSNHWVPHGVVCFDHPQTARSLDNLASLLQQQGNLTGARRLFERALAINESALSPEHPNLNQVRCNLARLLLAIGQPTEALVLAESALMAHDKILGPNQPWTQDSACVTAHALDVLDRSEEAAALRKRYGLTGA